MDQMSSGALRISRGNRSDQEDQVRVHNFFAQLFGGSAPQRKQQITEQLIANEQF